MDVNSEMYLFAIISQLWNSAEYIDAIKHLK